jgi:hypothetical protein
MMLLLLVLLLLSANIGYVGTIYTAVASMMPLRDFHAIDEHAHNECITLVKAAYRSYRGSHEPTIGRSLLRLLWPCC